MQDVQQRLDGLYRSKKLSAEELDPKCFDLLHAMPSNLAVAALDKLALKDLQGIRNMTAFFLSHLKTVRVCVDEGAGGGHAHAPGHVLRKVVLGHA